MKKWIFSLCLTLLLFALCAGCALANGNSYGVTFHTVDAERISVKLPDGMVADVRTEDGILRVVIDDDATDWRRVLCSGGYPYVTIRPTIERPNDSVTGHYGFTGGVNDVSEDYIITWLEREIANYENDHLQWSNGEMVGEIIADRALFVPQGSGNPDADPETWGGTVVCWVDQNNPGYRHYEKALFCITHKSDDPFYVPLRFISAEMLAPTRNLTLPANIGLTLLENGELTYTVLYEDDSLEWHEQMVSACLRAPKGAAAGYIVHDSGYREELAITDGVAVIEGIHYANISRVDERQYTIIWNDAEGNLLDYGLFWVHIVPPENDPWANYVESWQPVASDRLIIRNGAAGCGVDVTYTESTGTLHIGYDNSVSISDEPGNVGVFIIPPEGAVCFRSNGSGGNVIMGKDDFMAKEQHAIVLQQEYQMLHPDELFCVRDHNPFREVHAGPITVYIQDGAVWPYGGGVNLIYWYDSVDAAINTPEKPMLIEYVCDTNDVLCQVKRSSLIPSEDEITEPVKDVTAVGNYPWKLVVRRYPQKGSNAFHWELQLENETGAYQPLTGNMIFYVPYPKGHDNHTAYTYELRHYDDDHSSFTLVDARRTEYGLRFEVSSLSPFVMSWTEAEHMAELTLPADLKEIGEEAFASMTMSSVILPEGVMEIGAKAFAGCSYLTSINLPESLTHIAPDAFSGCGSLTAIVKADSYAHQWCIKHSVDCEVQ